MTICDQILNLRNFGIKTEMVKVYISVETSDKLSSVHLCMECKDRSGLSLYKFYICTNQQGFE